MDYCIVNDENIIENLIVAEPDVAAQLGALPRYEDAEIGRPYAPPEGWPPPPPPVYTPLEEAQQDITDLQLDSIAQGQYITDLELMILEGQADV